MITYLFLFCATICHLVFDVHKQYSGNPIRHWVSAWVAISVSLGFGIIIHFFTKYEFWQFTIYSLAVHFCFFDYLWNLTNHKPWNYNGDPKNPSRAWSDKMYDYIPFYAQPLLRLWVLAVGWCIYYRWDLISGL